MKTTKQIEIPARIEVRDEFIACDICGTQTNANCVRGNWAKDTYDATETEVRYKDGSSYPEGGSGEQMEIDICPKCFLEKLVPWVESFGISKIEKKEWDFDYERSRRRSGRTRWVDTK